MSTPLRTIRLNENEVITIYQGKHSERIKTLLSGGIPMRDILECLIEGNISLEYYGKARLAFSHAQIMEKPALALKSFILFHLKYGFSYEDYLELNSDLHWAPSAGGYYDYAQMGFTHEEALSWSQRACDIAREHKVHRAGFSSGPANPSARVASFFINRLQDAGEDEPPTLEEVTQLFIRAIGQSDTVENTVQVTPGT